MKIGLLLMLLCFTFAWETKTGIDSMPQNLQMQYKITGEGTPLVLVPGGLTGWASWDSFVPVFSPERKVIQLQLLNVQYGLTNEALPESYSVSMESKALDAALSELKLEDKADFIGWSYGAMVLLDYALNNPDKIRSLILIEPPALWIIQDEIAQVPELQTVKNTLAAFPQDEVTDDDLEKFLAFAGLSKPGESAKEMPQWDAWRNYKQSLRSNPAVAAHTDDPKRLRKITAPVLLVKGTDSADYYHRILARCVDAFPNAALVELPGGHAAHIVSSDKFLQSIEEFLK